MIHCFQIYQISLYLSIKIKQNPRILFKKYTQKERAHYIKFAINPNRKNSDKNPMIEKKQPVTKQFLLSFKSGHGDFYQKFINILHGKVDYCRRVKDHESCPPHMMAEKCIFMAILERKHEKFKNQEFQLSQLMTVFQKYRPQILKSIFAQKNCILKKMKNFKIEEMENSIVQIVTRENFGWNSFDLPENTYIYELFKAILSRSQQVSIFGQHKYQPMTYSYLQVKQISSLFNESIVYFDYNSSKSAATNLKFSHQTTYILKVKERYTILYVKQPKEISIQSSGTIPLAEVEAIFIKDLPKKKQQERGFFDKLLGSKVTEASQLRQSSKLFPDQIQCAKCSKKFSEFDCLKWNYEFFCQQCLQNPKLDTSSIPSTLIQKYFMERNIKHDDYQIQCPQCTGFTYIRKYNPSKKPHKIRCEVCEHNICLQHNQSINQCFCQCLQCRNAPTINVLHLNIAVCESCRKKFCRVCQKLSVDFCQCICKVCFERKDDDHICKERCHYCRNHVNNMKVCGCGGKMCYGCYYYNLKEFGKMDKFQCVKKNSYFK